jgi:hypothetical protein
MTSLEYVVASADWPRHDPRHNYHGAAGLPGRADTARRSRGGASDHREGP